MYLAFEWVTHTRLLRPGNEIRSLWYRRKRLFHWFGWSLLCCRKIVFPSLNHVNPRLYICMVCVCRYKRYAHSIFCRESENEELRYAKQHFNVCESLSCVARASYLKNETLWTGKLVVPHGFVHEQEEQAGQESQSDEDQTCNLRSNTHINSHTYNSKCLQYMKIIKWCWLTLHILWLATTLPQSYWLPLNKMWLKKKLNMFIKHLTMAECSMFY